MSVLEGRKIIGFDGWSGGIRHYSRFVNSPGYKFGDFKLIHLGSWGAQPDVPKHEVIDGIDVYDISFYGKVDYFELLDIEKPDLVVFLSTHVFDHRAMLMACRKKGIKTLHIFPGVLGVLSLDKGRAYKFSLLSHAKNILNRLPKLIGYSLLNYISVLIKTGVRFNCWLELFRDLVFGALRLNFPRYAEGSCADLCLVFLGSEKKIAIEKYGYSIKDVRVIGLPDVLDFSVREDDVLSCAESFKDKNKVLYFDTGYLYTGDLFSSVEEYVNHIVQLDRHLSSQGMKLIFKPKPQKFNRLKDELLKRLDDEGVEVYEGREVLKLLKESCFVLSEPSTVVLVAALLGMPVFLVGFGRFEGQEYGECILSYPRSEISDGYQSLTVEKALGVSCQSVRSWVEETFDGNPIKDVPLMINESINHLVN